MNVAQKNKFKEHLKSGARAAFFLVGFLYGPDPLSVIVWGLICMIGGFVAADIANTVIGLGWAAISRAAGSQIGIWGIGPLAKGTNGQVQMRNTTDPLLIFRRPTMLPETPGERMAVMGGVITAAAWVLITLPWVPFTLLVFPDYFVWAVLLFLGAVYSLILNSRYQVEPTGSPVWLYSQSRGTSPASIGGRIMDRAEELRQTTGTYRQLSEEEIAALRQVQSPLLWKLLAQKMIISWLSYHHRYDEAERESDVLVEQMEECRYVFGEQTYCNFTVEAALLAAYRGKFEKAEALAEKIQVTDFGAMPWHALQALLLQHRGYREDAEVEFRKCVALAEGEPLKTTEAQSLRFREMKEEFPQFAHLIPNPDAATAGVKPDPRVAVGTSANG